MPADPLDVQLPRARSLALLAEDVRLAQEVVSEQRRAPVVRDRLLAARQSLLVAMESYVAELTGAPPRDRAPLAGEDEIGAAAATELWLPRKRARS